MSCVTLNIKVNDPEAEKYYINHSAAYEGDCGIDLFVLKDMEIVPGTTKKIDLGISCSMQDENGKLLSYNLFPRSSISKTSLRLANSVGVIDSGYRGNIIAMIDNILSIDFTGDIITEPYQIKAGERLVQICAPSLCMVKVNIVDQHPESERGTRGFGSSS